MDSLLVIMVTSIFDGGASPILESDGFLAPLSYDSTKLCFIFQKAFNENMAFLSVASHNEIQICTVQDVQFHAVRSS